MGLKSYSPWITTIIMVNKSYYPHHLSSCHARCLMSNGIGRSGDREHEGVGAGYSSWDHQVQRVGLSGNGNLSQDREQDVGSGHIAGDLSEASYDDADHNHHPPLREVVQS